MTPLHMCNCIEQRDLSAVNHSPMLRQSVRCRYGFESRGLTRSSSTAERHPESGRLACGRPFLLGFALTGARLLSNRQLWRILLAARSGEAPLTGPTAEVRPNVYPGPVKLA